MAPLPTGVDMVLVGASDPAGWSPSPQECRELGLPFVADVSQQVTRMEGPEIRSSSRAPRFLMTNDYEFELLLRKTGWTEAEVADGWTCGSPRSASTACRSSGGTAA